MRTVLPEKWYVVRTPENAQVLNDWADTVVDDPEDFKRFKGSGLVFSDGETFPYMPARASRQGWPEITYEEFTKLVLNKSV